MKSISVANLHADVHLFSMMYIACHAREGDLDTFFEHENHSWLQITQCIKQAIRLAVMLVESLVPYIDYIPNVSVRIVDGAVLVHCPDPKKSTHKVKTFKEYAQLIFLSCAACKLQDVLRLDVVWGIYRKNSLKSQTHKCRGDGNRLLLSNSTSLPYNWKLFLRDHHAKKEGVSDSYPLLCMNSSYH